MFRATEKSQTLLLNEQSQHLESAGRKVYKMGFGQSPFMPLPRAQEALKNAVHRKDYSPVQGLPQLCQRVADFHSQVDGHSIDPKHVLIGAGSKILLFNTMLAFESAVVLMAAPSWVSYVPQATMARHKYHYVPTSYEQQWRIQPHVLDEILSLLEYETLDKLLIINYPGNPEGLTYTSDELQALAEVLRKHQAWVLSDEIYALLHHEGKHQSIRHYYPERTIITTGLSKWSGAGGWRLGAQILPSTVPDEFLDVLLGIASETFSCASTPVQVAACEAYIWDDETQNYLIGQRRILSALGNYCQQKLSNCGIGVHPPHGGFYLMVDFSSFEDVLTLRDIHDDSELCSRIVDETGVALLPGNAFGNSGRSYTARLSYVDFDGDFALKHIDQLDISNPETWLQQYCTHMLEGIDAIIAWVNQLK